MIKPLGLQQLDKLHIRCKKQPESRPASAASQGISRVPSQGMPSMHRPLSAPAERSGWDWAEELPATTSALLQAVEAAAAAEPEADNAVQQAVDIASTADMPIQSANSPMLSHQDSLAAPHYSSQMGPAQVGLNPAAPQGAFIGRPTGCHLRQASWPNVPVERGTMQFDCNRTARSDAATDAMKGPALTTRPPLSPSTLRSNGQGPLLQPPAAKAQHSLAQSAPTALGMNATNSGRKRSYAHSQERCLPPDTHMRGLHAVCQTELLPGRNVIVAAGYINDLTQLEILPSKWCWVARIDKVMAVHMKVSFYGKHNGRWTLARHGAGPDEGQVYTGDVSLSVHQEDFAQQQARMRMLIRKT
ncbi:hypothetical protein WJX82_011623 [Trebouxia sp. C0006]